MKKLGETFIYKGVRLITVESEVCEGCYLYEDSEGRCKDTRFSCTIFRRKDNLSVHFPKWNLKFGR